jgi:hypothetical protein
MTDPIRKTVTVPLATRDAFDLFTARIDQWWPKDTHSVAASNGTGADAQVRIEPHEGGHVIETGPDGSEAAWATVTRWEPGRRVTLDWHPGRGEDQATRVDVTFEPTEGGTRVDLTHDGFDVLGDDAATMCASYTTGWDHVLGGCYVGQCRRKAA